MKHSWTAKKVQPPMPGLGKLVQKIKASLIANHASQKQRAKVEGRHVCLTSVNSHFKIAGLFVSFQNFETGMTKSAGFGLLKRHLTSDYRPSHLILYLSYFKT